MNWQKIIFVMFFLGWQLLSFNWANANMELQLATNKNKININEKFNLILTLKQTSNNTSLEINNGINVPGLENFQVWSNSSSTQIQSINGAMAAVSTNTKVLTANKAGEFTIGPVIIPANAILGINQDIVSNKVTIAVAEIPVKNNNNNDLSPDKSLHWSVFLGLSFFLVSLMLLFYSNKSKKTINLPLSNKPVSVNLSVEQKNNLIIPQIDQPNFYIELKNNLLLFLSQKYNINTQYKTSAEIIAELEKLDCDNLKDITHILKVCDQAKFGQNESGKAELINQIKMFVQMELL